MEAQANPRQTKEKGANRQQQQNAPRAKGTQPHMTERVTHATRQHTLARQRGATPSRTMLVQVARHARMAMQPQLAPKARRAVQPCQEAGTQRRLKQQQHHGEQRALQTPLQCCQKAQCDVHHRTKTEGKLQPRTHARVRHHERRPSQCAKSLSMAWTPALQEALFIGVRRALCTAQPKGHWTPLTEAGESRGMLGTFPTLGEGNIREHAPSHFRTLGGQRATKPSRPRGNDEIAEQQNASQKNDFFNHEMNVLNEMVKQTPKREQMCFQTFETTLSKVPHQTVKNAFFLHPHFFLRHGDTTARHVSQQSRVDSCATSPTQQVNGWMSGLEREPEQ